MTTRPARHNRMAEKTGARRITFLSESDLKSDDPAPERRLPGQRTQARVADLLFDQIELHFHPSVRVPVHAEGRHTIAVADHDVGAHAGGTRLVGAGQARFAAERDLFDAHGDLDGARPEARQQRPAWLIEPL